MGAKSQTIGYHYLMSMLSGLWRGPLDAIVGIRVGDKDAWVGNVTDDSMQMIDAPELFGGEKKEGGIQGGFRVFMGQATQVLPPAANYGSLSGVLNKLGPASNGTLQNPKTLIGGQVSEFRGVATFWFDGLVSSMNPYPKEWKFRGRRQRKGWYLGHAYPGGGECWYSAKARIEMAGGAIHAMNPAHIVYQCCTDPSWGRGLPPTELDTSSFTYSADLFFNESFGLCLTWFRSDGEDVEDFIKVILDHAGAALYTSRETGLLTLRPIRADFDVEDLPLFTEDSGLLSIADDDGSSSPSNYNEVIVTGHSPIDDKDFQMRAQNVAAWQETKAANALKIDYKGLPTPDLASRVAERDLKVHASGLKKYKVILDRHAWRIAPGSCFRVTSLRRGIANLVLRVGEIAESPINDGRITITAVEDVFALAQTSIIDPVESTWQPPITTALPPTARILMEAGYRDVYLHSSQADATTVLPNESTIMQMATAPNVYSQEYDLMTKAEGEEYEIRASGHFTGTATLTLAVNPLTATFALTALRDLSEDNIGEALWIEDELVALLDLDPDTNVATVKRGCGDTVPRAHGVGARVWTIDDDAASDQRVYVEGETAYTKVLTRTSSERLHPDFAAENSVLMVGRVARPYPPADLKVNGISFYAFVGSSDEPVVLTYASRNRLSQADVLVGHSEPSVAAEPGTTYRIRLGLPGEVTPFREATTADLTWTYTDEMRVDDGQPSDIWMEVASVRDGLESWQQYHFDVSLDYTSELPPQPIDFDSGLTDTEGDVDVTIDSDGDSGTAVCTLTSGETTSTEKYWVYAPISGRYNVTMSVSNATARSMYVCRDAPDEGNKIAGIGEVTSNGVPLVFNTEDYTGAAFFLVVEASVLTETAAPEVTSVFSVTSHPVS